MGVTKYFVWGEGVWREVDVSSGRVVGWRRRARFVFVRRGRLQVARRRGVLRALRALAAGQPSAAADGPRLAHCSRSAVVATKKLALPAPAPVTCEHHHAHHCCGHFNGYNNNNSTFNELNPVNTPPAPLQKCEAGTQCGRKDTGTSTEKRHAITIDLSQTTRMVRNNEHSSGEDFITTPTKRKLPTTHSTSNKTEVDALLGKWTTTEISKPSASSVTSNIKHVSVKSVDVARTSVDDGRKLKDKQKTRIMNDATDMFADNRKPLQKTLKTSSPKKSRESVESQACGAVCKELVIPEEDVAALRAFVARTRASALARFDSEDEYKRALFYAINPLVELERCARLERALRERAAVQFAARLGLARRADVPAQASRAQRRRAAVRYTERNSSTDTDKENKQHSRASTNKQPERGKRTRDAATEPATSFGENERGNKVVRTTEPKTEMNETSRTTRASGARAGMTERGNKEDVKERDDEPAAYRTKISVEDQTKIDSVVERSRGAIVEQTSKRPVQQLRNKPKTVQHDSNTKESVFKERKKYSTANGSNKSTEQHGSQESAPQRSKEPVVANGVMNDGDDAEQSRARAPHVISQRACASQGKEYSNLEDHVMVAWVSDGARARLVNGNRLWRELQAAWPRLAGRARSWHSLRNRYLRYVLPALPALQLPPAQVSRLRAAAATGAIKRKAHAALGTQRRNSIFKEDVQRGAASRVRTRTSPARDQHARAAPQHARAAQQHAHTDTTSAEVASSSVRRSLRSHAREEDGDRSAPARSPRYSDVTRRFAARHRHTDTSSTPTPTSSPSPSPSPTSPAPAPRSRRLYNPNM